MTSVPWAASGVLQVSQALLTRGCLNPGSPGELGPFSPWVVRSLLALGSRGS